LTATLPAREEPTIGANEDCALGDSREEPPGETPGVLVVRVPRRRATDKAASEVQLRIGAELVSRGAVAMRGWFVGGRVRTSNTRGIDESPPACSPLSR
jgi:hypothetical protein